MKNIGVILAVGITAAIIITIGVLNFNLVSEAAPSSSIEPEPAASAEITEVQDVAAIQAAYEARETLLIDQIEDLDAEYSARQAAYDQQSEELSALIVTGDEQLVQMQEAEIALQEQIDQLLATQTERAGIIEGQRQGAYYQYQVNIQQIQAQLDEAKGKLNEALVRLGQ